MTDAVAISVVGMLGSVLAALIGLWNNVLARQNTLHIEETKNAIKEVEKQTNSMKDALVKVTGEKEFAKGLKAGQEEPR